MNAKEEAIVSFRLLLLTVLGQALTAAGYRLTDDPVAEAAGRFQFLRSAGAAGERRIEFQLLAGTSSEWAPQMPSRFRVTLVRDADSRSLAALVVKDFNVAILPSADHWWSWQNSSDAGAALAEAGHLLIGFGLPWLSGELEPPA